MKLLINNEWMGLPLKIEIAQRPTGVGPPQPNQVSAPIKYVTGASNGEIGEIFGKLTYSAIKISQSFSKRMGHDMESMKRAGSILAEYLGVAGISF